LYHAGFIGYMWNNVMKIDIELGIRRLLGLPKGYRSVGKLDRLLRGKGILIMSPINDGRLKDEEKISWLGIFINVVYLGNLFFLLDVFYDARFKCDVE
jgi:hypothetical protein